MKKQITLPYESHEALLAFLNLPSVRLAFTNDCINVGYESDEAWTLYETILDAVDDAAEIQD